MISKELSGVLAEIQILQARLIEKCRYIDDNRKASKTYEEAALKHEAEAKKIEADLDLLQIKLRQTILMDDRKYGIKGPTVTEPVQAESEPVQIGREE